MVTSIAHPHRGAQVKDNRLHSEQSQVARVEGFAQPCLIPKVLMHAYRSVELANL